MRFLVEAVNVGERDGKVAKLPQSIVPRNLTECFTTFWKKIWCVSHNEVASRWFKNYLVDPFERNVHIMCKDWYCHCALQYVNEHEHHYLQVGNSKCILSSFFLESMLPGIVYYSKSRFCDLFVNIKTLQRLSSMGWKWIYLPTVTVYRLPHLLWDHQLLKLCFFLHFSKPGVLLPFDEGNACVYRWKF